MSSAIGLLILTLGGAPPDDRAPRASEAGVGHGAGLAVLAVADPPGPGPELVELAHQLRAACRDRTPGVVDAAELRARLLGQASSATLMQLERAYAGAMATYQNGEYASTASTLRTIVDDLERLPESAEAHSQWIRANLRLAHAEMTLGRPRAAREALERVAAVAPRHAPDPDQFSPTFRRELEAARARLASRPRRRLAVSAPGASAATVFVDGRPSGRAPLTLRLPPGKYRIGAAAGALRVPSAWVDLTAGDGSVVHDFVLAAAVRLDPGPGIAVDQPSRGASVLRAGAWIGVDRLLAASTAADAGVQYLVGTLYDVRRGAVLREGRVAMVARAVPAESVAALAAFLLTGQPSRAVVDSAAGLAASGEGAASDLQIASTAAPVAAGAEPTDAAPVGLGEVGSRPPELRALAPLPTTLEPLLRRPEPPAVPRRRSWTKPAAYTSGALAAGLAGLALHQRGDARSGYARAASFLRPDGTFASAEDASRFGDAVDAADAARRNAWIGVAGSVVFSAAAGVLGYLSWTDAGAPAVRF